MTQSDETTGGFSFEQWLSTLNGTLEALDAVFLDHSHDPHERYGGYLMSIAVIGAALKALPGFSAKLNALEDLAVRLDGLAAGQKKALLPLTKAKGGRPGYSTADWMTVGKSAAAAQILIDGGFEEEEANEIVSKALRSFGVKGRRGEKVTADTVRDWRCGAAEHGDKPEARDTFLQSLHTYNSLVGGNLQRHELKKIVPTIVKPFGFVPRANSSD